MTLPITGLADAALQRAPVATSVAEQQTVNVLTSNAIGVAQMSAQHRGIQAQPATSAADLQTPQTASREAAAQADATPNETMPPHTTQAFEISQAQHSGGLQLAQPSPAGTLARIQSTAGQPQLLQAEQPSPASTLPAGGSPHPAGQMTAARAQQQGMVSQASLASIMEANPLFSSSEESASSDDQRQTASGRLPSHAAPHSPAMATTETRTPTEVTPGSVARIVSTLETMRRQAEQPQSEPIAASRPAAAEHLDQAAWPVHASSGAEAQVTVRQLLAGARPSAGSAVQQALPANAHALLPLKIPEHPKQPHEQATSAAATPTLTVRPPEQPAASHSAMAGILGSPQSPGSPGRRGLNRGFMSFTQAHVNAALNELLEGVPGAAASPRRAIYDELNLTRRQGRPPRHTQPPSAAETHTPQQESAPSGSISPALPERVSLSGLMDPEALQAFWQRHTTSEGLEAEEEMPSWMTLTMSRAAGSLPNETAEIHPRYRMLGLQAAEDARTARRGTAALADRQSSVQSFLPAGHLQGFTSYGSASDWAQAGPEDNAISGQQRSPFRAAADAMAQAGHEQPAAPGFSSPYPTAQKGPA
ncbi:hypothetical protein WJX73_003658 [Symbiochloris irregularis]|uniref:Uncharacterized protein n=1 Tax=Symbiochloris irregularis TaxID=706552 RepID=A0AAW1NP67_9CHLO